MAVPGCHWCAQEHIVPGIRKAPEIRCAGSGAGLHCLCVAPHLHHHLGLGGRPCVGPSRAHKQEVVFGLLQCHQEDVAWSRVLGAGREKTESAKGHLLKGYVALVLGLSYSMPVDYDRDKESELEADKRGSMCIVCGCLGSCNKQSRAWMCLTSCLSS